MGQQETQSESRVIVVGVGLIGGSIAAAYRKRFSDADVIGIGRSAVRLQQAKEAGLISRYADSLTPELVREKCIVVICLPVDMIAETACQISRISGPETVITDAGSVKGVICEAIAKDVAAAEKFVGAHPIAGGENGGFEFADADLFDGRVCIVTGPSGGSEPQANVARVTSFWTSIGCHIKTMTAAEHDEVLAYTSHLPHVMAAVTTSAVGAENLSMCGSGFRDATRIAAGNASLWKAILTGNRKDVISAIRSAEQELVRFREALEAHDDLRLEELLALAADCRSQLN